MTTTIPQQNVTPPQGYVPTGWQGMPWNMGYQPIQGSPTGTPANGTKTTTDPIGQGAAFNPYISAQQFAGQPQNLTQISGQPTSVFAGTPMGFQPTGFTPYQTPFNTPVNTPHYTPFNSFNSPMNTGFQTPFGFSNPTQPWNWAFGCPDCSIGFNGTAPSFGQPFSNSFSPAFGFHPTQNWQSPFNSFGQNFNNTPFQTPWNVTGFDPSFTQPWNGFNRSFGQLSPQFGPQNFGNFPAFNHSFGNQPFNSFGTPFQQPIQQPFSGYTPFGFNNQQGINPTPFGFSVPFGLMNNQINTPFGSPFNTFGTPFSGPIGTPFSNPVNTFGTPFSTWNSPIGFQNPMGSPFGITNPSFYPTPFAQGVVPFNPMGFTPYNPTQTNTQCDTNAGGLNLNNQAA